PHQSRSPGHRAHGLGRAPLTFLVPSHQQERLGRSLEAAVTDEARRGTRLRWTCRARKQYMPHNTILFVHLQYDAPNSPQNRALPALAATVARTSAPPLYLVGGYAHDDFDTDSLPLTVAQAVRATHQARTATAMAGQLQVHVAALAAEQVAVTPLLRAGAPQIVLAQVSTAPHPALSP